VALYYEHAAPSKITRIGGIDDVPRQNQVSYICNIRLRFGNDMSVWRTFRVRTIPFKVTGHKLSGNIGGRTITCVTYKNAELGEESFQ
jgi:hypothetical protein